MIIFLFYYRNSTSRSSKHDYCFIVFIETSEKKKKDNEKRKKNYLYRV